MNTIIERLLEACDVKHCPPQYEDLARISLKAAPEIRALIAENERLRAVHPMPPKVSVTATWIEREPFRGQSLATICLRHPARGVVFLECSPPKDTRSEALEWAREIAAILGLEVEE